MLYFRIILLHDVVSFVPIAASQSHTNTVSITCSAIHYSLSSLSKFRTFNISSNCSPSVRVCACMELSATRDSGLLLTFDIPEGDQVSPLSSVIWLTWRRLLWWSADVCIELCNSWNLDFCKVPLQLCDCYDICSSSSVSFNDLEWPLSQISRSWYYSTTNNSQMVQDSYSYNGGLIESHTWSVEPCHFQSPWTCQTQTSRSGHSLTMNISKMATDMAIVTVEGK